MKKAAYFGYGVVCYLFFFVTILYAIGFVGNLFVSKSVDSGAEGSVALAVLVNVLLMGLFAVQHSVMARPGFKTWWRKYVPTPIERSTYVLAASFALMLLFVLWRPMTGIVWQVEMPAAQSAIWVAYAVGWALVFYSTFLIDHFDLFGLRQVYLNLIGAEYTNKPFRTPSVYRYVRNPLMLGFIIAFWSTSTMTMGHLLFAGVTTAYIFVGIAFEERDLIASLGEDYRQYREKTSMIVPLPPRRSRDSSGEQTS